MATLAFRVPATWTFSGTNERAEGRGPDGQSVIANYRKLKVDAPAEVKEEHWKIIRGFATDKMPQLAKTNGDVLRPVTLALQPGGQVQYSSVSQGRKVLRQYYFIQYLFGSSRSIVYLT